MKMDYCNQEDLQSSMPQTLYKHGYPYSFNVIGLEISKETKSEHVIAGWVCIAGVDDKGEKHLMRDIWVGFKYEKEISLRAKLIKLCSYMDLEYKCS